MNWAALVEKSEARAAVTIEDGLEMELSKCISDVGA